MNYDVLANEDSIAKTAEAIKSRGINVVVVNTGQEALEAIKNMIPKGAQVMNASSTTLEQIGFVAYLASGDHPWNNLHVSILMEKDEQKQATLRTQSILSEYFLGSVHAIAQTGEMVTASATGSQIPSYAFSSPHVIWVAGVNKIVPTLADALTRVREYTFPLENERMKKAGYPGSMIGKILINEREMPSSKATLILVREKLGF